MRTPGRCATCLLPLAASLGLGCLPKQDAGAEQAPAAPFSDDFNRAELGERYKKSGGTWAIVDGQLHSSGEKNIPLWLDVPLSKNVRVEFTTLSASPAVDTKIEIFGDGLRHESGYIVIMGGWSNTISTIARLDEHEKTRVEKRTKWKQNQRYRWKVERTDGKTLSFYLDDELVLAYDDAGPLFGPRNNKLGFTNWASDVYYDDLTITPLPD
jgi:hypothetical protein